MVAMHRLYVIWVYAQDECEGWSNCGIEQSVKRCYPKEDKEVQTFSIIVEEAENRNALLHDIRRAKVMEEG